MKNKGYANFFFFFFWGGEGGGQGALWEMCKWRMKELIYELPEEKLKVKKNNAVMDATLQWPKKA